MMNELNLEGLKEMEYMISSKTTLFPTYNCPFKSDECSLKNLTIYERYNNREDCLECKGVFLEEVLGINK